MKSTPFPWEGIPGALVILGRTQVGTILRFVHVARVSALKPRTHETPECTKQASMLVD